MNKTVVLLAVPLALASCSLLGVPNGDVSGNVLGKQPTEGAVRLAMRGATLSGFQTPVLDQGNIGTFNPEKRAYVISLPPEPADGAYELFAYVDTNRDNVFGPAEARTRGTTTTFVYSKGGNASLNVRPGWSLYEGLSLKKNGTPLTYHMDW